MRDIAPPKGEELIEKHTETMESQPRPRLVLRAAILFLVTIGLTLGFLAVKAGTTFSVVSEELKEFLGIATTRLPVGNPREENRVDILLLGLRGEGDPNGGLLTDTMIVVSIETEKEEVAFISVPRDIYVEVPVVEEYTKINAAYAFGEELEGAGGGLVLSRLAVQEVLGINIDHVIAADFQAFQDTVDLMNGIYVDVAQALYESQQWQGYEFSVPAGRQYMDGETALFYVRARFSTSDFDRSRRQQEVLVAMREKALSLGFLVNPTKLAGLLDILGRHVRTDMNAKDVRDLLKITRDVSDVDPKRLVLDTTKFLYATNVQGAYVLLPEGDTFETIRTQARNIFETPIATEGDSDDIGS